jgi:6-phosphogluconate dehydrogenase
MGTSLALHAREQGHSVVGYDKVVQGDEGIEVASSIFDLLSRLEPPRVVLIYVPHGEPTETVITELGNRCLAGDLVADGGNSHWRDSIRHAADLGARGIRFLDLGTSGGVEGARRGACFMVGGEKEAFETIAPLLRDLAVPDGVAHVGRAGAGHFAKLVHNGIEFGMLQAIAEGVDLLVDSGFDYDLPALFHNWAHGSVIRGWLVELMEKGLKDFADWSQLSSYVEDTREVKWLVQHALEREVWIPVIADAELALYRYRDPDSVAAKAVAILRHEFGGHPIHLTDSSAAPDASSRPATPSRGSNTSRSRARSRHAAGNDGE